jgi:putative phosphoesterase
MEWHGMRIAVLSDTHGKAESTKAALELIRKRDVAAILHCGDIGGAGLIELFSDWPTHFVFGNVDDDRDNLHKAIQAAGQTSHGIFGEVVLEDVRIAVLHGDDGLMLRETIASGRWNLVCYGHTHRREMHREGPTVVLNPGALYRARPRTFAIVELPSLAIEFLTVPLPS